MLASRETWRTVLGALALGGLVSLGAQEACPDCPDPTRPWMRGGIEIRCAPPMHVDALRRQYPEAIVHACPCQHTCDPTADHADDTDNRGWDARCEARCNPRGCTCEHPCES